MPLAALDETHVLFAAGLHARALEGGLLPSLGVPFLESFYCLALRFGPATGIVWLEGSTPIGFVLGSRDSASLLRQVARAGVWSLGCRALPAVLRRPGLLLQMIETLRYRDLEKVDDVHAELIVLAVDPAHHRRGIGRALCRALLAEFLRQGITQHKVTVHQTNETANAFYAAQGYRRVRGFRLFGREWNLYVSGEP